MYALPHHRGPFRNHAVPANLGGGTHGRANSLSVRRQQLFLPRWRQFERHRVEPRSKFAAFVPSLLEAGQVRAKWTDIGPPLGPRSGQCWSIPDNCWSTLAGFGPTSANNGSNLWMGFGGAQSGPRPIRELHSSLLKLATLNRKRLNDMRVDRRIRHVK